MNDQQSNEDALKAADDLISALDDSLAHIKANPESFRARVRSVVQAYNNPDVLRLANAIKGMSEEEFLANVPVGLREKSERLMSIINGEGLRSHVIVFAAQIEDAIELLILKRLRPARCQGKNSNKLFAPLSPLSTFAAKIEMGYRIGAYSEARASALDVLRKIRNTFAHQVVPVDVGMLAKSRDVERFFELTHQASPHAIDVFLVISRFLPINKKTFAWCCLDHLFHLWGAIESIPQIDDASLNFATIPFRFEQDSDTGSATGPSSAPRPGP